MAKMNIVEFHYSGLRNDGTILLGEIEKTKQPLEAHK